MFIFLQTHDAVENDVEYKIPTGSPFSATPSRYPITRPWGAAEQTSRNRPLWHEVVERLRIKHADALTPRTLSTAEVSALSSSNGPGAAAGAVREAIEWADLIFSEVSDELRRIR